MTSIAFESFAVTTVLPVAMTDLDGAQWYSLAYAATITAALVGMVIGGNWSDRSGPRRPLVAGGSLFLGGLALCMVAPEPSTFVLGRLLQGIGGGIDSVVLYVLIARRIPERPRPRMFGLLTTAWLVPSLVGPVLAGALTDLMTWRVVFGIVLAGAAISLGGLLHVTRDPGMHSTEPVGDGPARPIIGRNGTLSLVAALLLVLLHLGGQLDPPASILAVIAASIGLVVVAQGILPSGTLRLRGAAQRLVALRAILGATVTATDLYLTLYLQTERGLPPTKAGLVIAIGALGWAFGAWAQARFTSEHAIHRRLILLAAPLVGVGPVSVLLYTAAGLPLWPVVAGCIAMGTGMGMAYPRLSSATLALASADEQGAYSSALQAGESMSVGATTALTAVVLTSALSASISFTLVYAILVALACLAIAISSTSGPLNPASRS
ncbi:MFS transporter [Ruania albidiflava]|uniref:MFS transporter n=1 Tax=Ruania albidiflava TaxID=366586 RepID=UPI0023F01CE5|nr:MFS transporter [Ruania albidiflava]